MANISADSTDNNNTQEDRSFEENRDQVTQAYKRNTKTRKKNRKQKANRMHYMLPGSSMQGGQSMPAGPSMPASPSMPSGVGMASGSVMPLGSGTPPQVYLSSSPQPLLRAPYPSAVPAYYPRNWPRMVARIPRPIYHIPYRPLQVVVTQILSPATTCPVYTCAVMTPQVITPACVAQPILTKPAYEPALMMYTGHVDNTINQINNTSYCEEINQNAYTDQNETIGTQSEETFYSAEDNSRMTTNEESLAQDLSSHPLEMYLTLPKNLFPAPRMLTIDPNPVIDEVCKLKNVYDHAPWLLDLEFGIPKDPVTRPIPIYNVNFNSIHCKNTPDAIHPGFDCCNENFQNVFKFYYDCMISSLYTGYVTLSGDSSVDNFQSWILYPMQELGMCWP